jgi:hypothetical protein
MTAPSVIRACPGSGLALRVEPALGCRASAESSISRVSTAAGGRARDAQAISGAGD